MAKYENSASDNGNDTLESKFHDVGIGAVTAAAQYCVTLKARPAVRKHATNPQMSASVNDTD
ncbi:MAG: hypothetical protein KDJ55_05810 [Rhodobiaceae bacterium]|nr:hypothetical protein [Rhodobiaceae bacterium]MCC0018900.1 hypothetical protein [Rhodobiaceae bacterium]MCC0051209.1 hypothetical protein [Rhodobiaceae bacterium]MCC0059942.1 hypothetical protein [Rhodobiaceae bacterium]